MKYIDLENKTFTHPVSKVNVPIILQEISFNTCFLVICNGIDNSEPLRLLGVSDDYERRNFLEYYGFKPKCFQREEYFPEFETKNEVVKLCNLLNELLTEKYAKPYDADDAVPFNYRFEDYRMTITRKEENKPSDDNMIKLEFE